MSGDSACPSINVMYLTRMSGVEEHIKFMNTRICNVAHVPNVSSSIIQKGFNHGFAKATREVTTEWELNELEDIYWCALFTMEEFEKESHIARQFITIIRHRLKRLWALSRKVE